MMTFSHVFDLHFWQGAGIGLGMDPDNAWFARNQWYSNVTIATTGPAVTNPDGAIRFDAPGATDRASRDDRAVEQ